MNESGGLLARSSRGYGAVRRNDMVTKTDLKMISHKLEPSDTLQSLAIKYDVSVERIKRVNKLWSNDSILTKETLLIPCPKDSRVATAEQNGVSIDQLTLFLDAGKKVAADNTCFTKSDSYLCNALPGYHSLNTQGNLTNSLDNRDSTKDEISCNELFSKIDKQLNNFKTADTSKSASYNSLNEMLNKIDGQIKDQKIKTSSQRNLASDIPVVSYEGGYQRVTYYDT